MCSIVACVLQLNCEPACIGALVVCCSSQEVSAFSVVAKKRIAHLIDLQFESLLYVKWTERYVLLSCTGDILHTNAAARPPALYLCISACEVLASALALVDRAIFRTPNDAERW